MAKAEATISSKGQLVIPAEIRRRMKLGSGDRVRFVETDRGLLIEKRLVPLADDPFAVFTEWASPEDDEAYRNL